jgi:uncharacterized protein YhhL (DUF1145 family)
LAAAHPEPATADDLAAVAVAYVLFALEHPALFRVMFAEPCDPTSPERVEAATVIMAYVNAIVTRAFPGVEVEGMATAVWALVHGLAFLFLDGKLDASSPEVVADRVRITVHAVLSASKNLAEA